MAGGSEAEQLRRGDVRDRELVLRVARALLPAQPLGLVEEGIAQGGRVAIDARVTLLFRAGKGEVSVIDAGVWGGHLDTRGQKNVVFTYTGKTKHGGEEQGAAKLGLVGHEIA